ncbi:cuticle protein 65-like [Ixodes scapularis]|uniref:Secreted salivary gland peptide, putative n=1 Tax=Ixodes scapularis TaxID=6945 RepID=B7QBH5_IXOSC|nr:cuticle protein 65-like [Ixodes scapularis]EEC16197.1 secreted salivary gland peptide, putative [Ixodes scapularis]|eukprot:XP_002412901.1 secreted salivary gland peptide, putative [Ixodes scapularis]
MHSLFIATVFGLMAAAWAAPQFPVNYALPLAGSYGLAGASSDKLTYDYTRNSASAASVPVAAPVVAPPAPVAVLAPAGAANAAPVYGYGVASPLAYAPVGHVVGLGYGRLTYGLGSYNYGLHSLGYGGTYNEHGYGF